MTTNWADEVNAIDFFRTLQKRVNMLERRGAAFGGEAAAPGLAPNAVALQDWNDEVATFNGFYYSSFGAVNTPTPDYDVPYVGFVVSRDDLTGAQFVWEVQPPEGEEPILPPDPPSNPVTPADPEPAQPTTGNPTPVREWIRYYSTNDDGIAVYTEWKPRGTESGTALRDLSDVKVFDPVEDMSVLLWKQDYDGGVGAWVPHPYIPGIAGLRVDVDQALQDAEDAFMAAEASIYSFRQTTPPVPGVGGVPDPIRPNSIWFDTDDGNRQYVWNSVTLSWVPADTLLTGVTIQTTALANRGIKLSDTALVAYNPAGGVTVLLDATTGTLSLSGALIAGGEIQGTLITGTTGLQTDLAANRGVKINNQGILGYNSQAGNPLLGTLMFALRTDTGSLTVRGDITSGSTINGATITGTTISGNAIVGGTIDGTTITGGLIRTSTSGKRITLGVDGFDGAANEMTLYSGTAGEHGGSITSTGPTASGNNPAILITTPYLFTPLNALFMRIEAGNQPGGAPGLVSVQNGSFLADGSIIANSLVRATRYRSLDNSSPVLLGDTAQGVEAPAFIKSGSDSVNLATVNTSVAVTVTFAVAFPSSAPIPKIMVTTRGVTGNVMVTWSVTAVSRSSFTVRGIRNAGTGVTDFDWVAIAA